MKGPPKELISLRDKLQAAHAASESRRLDSKHYRGVDVAIGEALEQLPPVYRGSYSDSDESLASETKQGDSPVAAVDSSSARALQVLLAEHEGPLRSMLTNPGTLGIGRRAGIEANLDDTRSPSARDDLGMRVSD